MEIEKEEEATILIADGACSSSENMKAAVEKNVHLVTTGLVGRNARSFLPMEQEMSESP